MMLKLKFQYFGHFMWRVDSLEKTLMLEGLGAGGEGDDRGWDGWMASPTWWTWVWVNSGSWWWTGRLGVLRFMGSQRVGHDWATELNWGISSCIGEKQQLWEKWVSEKGKLFLFDNWSPYSEKKKPCGKKISFFKAFAPTVLICSSIEQKQSTSIWTQLCPLLALWLQGNEVNSLCFSWTGLF